MRRATEGLLIALLLALPATASAQDTAQVAPVPPPAPVPANQNIVRPGMSEADVRAAWGEPVVVRRANEWTYMFYRNWNEQQVGYLDVVFLQNGQVVDAIVRNVERAYLGTSSSPGTRNPEATPPQQRPDGAASGAVTGVRLTP